MIKCGKSFMPECEYFTTCGCVSPFNCPYKTEQEVKTGTRIPWHLLYPLETEKDKEIARLTAENERLREEVDSLSHENDELEYMNECLESELTADTRELFGKIEQLKSKNNNLSVELEVAQRDIENLTRTLEEANDEIKALEAENTELKARLEKAAELPKIGDEIYIIEDGYCDCAEVCEIHIQEKDTIVEWEQWDRSNYETPEFYDEGEVLMSEYNKTWFTDRSEAEARLAELKGGVRK